MPKNQLITDLDAVDPVARLTAEVRAMAGRVPREQARNMVDLFYRLQRMRIDTGNQSTALAKLDRPTDIADHFRTQMASLEKQMESVLDAYSMSSEVGKWSRSIYGIGPVIAAGLLAHIDIEKSPTVGSIWRFAGLDPTVVWHGTKAADELVGRAFKVENHDASAVWWLATATSYRTTDLLVVAGLDAVQRHDVLSVLSSHTELSNDELRDLDVRYPMHDDNLIRHACELAEVHPADIYITLYGEGTLKLNKTAIKKMLAKRPWNNKLKTLCWKLGESFVKFSNRPECVYGHLYRSRKNVELERDERGDNVEEAERTLKAKNIRDEDTRAAYESGHLPAGRLDMRARRWAVKIFLSHWHYVAYKERYGTPPPLPYVLEHVPGHHDMIVPPGYEADFA